MSPIDHLNREQREAATKIKGVIRAIAGPGTGKTAMKTARIAYMVQQGITPESIVALTFTNKAADEMRERIAQQAGDDGYRVFAGTYHSFFIQKILKPSQKHEYFKSLGYPNGFFILDDNDSKRLMDQTLKSLPGYYKLAIDTLGIDKKTALNWMSGWRAQGYSEQDVLRSMAIDSDTKDAWIKFTHELKKMADDTYTAEEAERPIKEALRQHPILNDILMARVVWGEYSKACVQAEGIDFDDVLVHAKRLLLADPRLAERLARTYQYFSLDEYQDTNKVQHDVIHAIATASDTPPNIFTVGDTRQSIYGFRKADVRLMSQMDTYYKDIQDVVLSVNYRSTDNLLQATNALAKTMAEQLTEGQLKTPKAKAGNSPVVAHFDKDEDEARWVCDQLQEQLNNGEDLSQTAILYRSRALRNAIEAELLSRDLSYDIIGDTSFWERKEVRDMLALIRVIVRPNDDLAMYRLLDSSTLPLTTLTARKKAEREGVRPLMQLQDIAFPKTGRMTQKSVVMQPFLTRFNTIKDNISLIDPTIDNFKLLDEKLLSPIQERGNNITIDESSRQLMDQMRKFARSNNVLAFGDVIEGLYDDYIWPRTQAADEKDITKRGANTEELFERLETRKQNARNVIKIFIDQLKKGLSTQEALDELALRAEAQPEQQQATVKMMTNHASKGLQFKRTYVIGAESEAYWRDDVPSVDDFNEEGRNFYVAITRAEQDLTITTCATRFINGEVKCHTPLPFLAPVEEHAQVLDMRNEYNKAVSRNANSNDTYDYRAIAGVSL